jgi:hypothetical protein
LAAATHDVLAASSREGLDDLVEEIVRTGAEAEHREAEYDVTRECDRVVAQRVTYELFRPGVLDPIDLDSDSPLRPSIEEVGATRGPAQRLAIGFGNHPFAAAKEHIELVEGTNPSGQLEHDLAYQQPAPVSPYAQ